MAKKHARTDRSDTKVDTHSKHREGNMTKIYLTDSDEETIVINQHFKDKARKEYLRESFSNSCKLSVKVCKIWSQRTHYGKIYQLHV